MYAAGYGPAKLGVEEPDGYEACRGFLLSRHALGGAECFSLAGIFPAARVSPHLDGGEGPRGCCWRAGQCFGEVVYAVHDKGEAAIRVLFHPAVQSR